MRGGDLTRGLVHARWEERPLALKLPEEELQPLLLIPFGIAPNPEVASDGVDDIRVPRGLLADVELHHAEAKGPNLSDEIEETSIGHRLVARSHERVVHLLEGVKDLLDRHEGSVVVESGLDVHVGVNEALMEDLAGRVELVPHVPKDHPAWV